MQELKNRLEILLGSRPEAPEFERMKERATEESARLTEQQRDRVAAAGGELLGAAFKLLGELVSQTPTAAPPDALVASLRSSLQACAEGDEKPRLTITLPDRSALDQLSQSLARLLVATGSTGSTEPGS
jgi:hypothetical protein